jgi:hypothetical protein
VAVGNFYSLGPAKQRIECPLGSRCNVDIGNANLPTTSQFVLKQYVPGSHNKIMQQMYEVQNMTDNTSYNVTLNYTSNFTTFNKSKWESEALHLLQPGELPHSCGDPEMQEVYNASVDFNYRSNTINFKYSNLHTTVANDDTLILCWRRWPKGAKPSSNLNGGFVQYSEYETVADRDNYREGNNFDSKTEEYQIGHFVVSGPKVFN